ncbi:hypothetical protein BGX33_000990, partial [Mortierella sp. NVP41]
MDYIRFVNKHWMYPGPQPDELRNLHPSAEGFLSPISVFCELTNSRSKLTSATRAGQHFVSGRMGLYKSNEYLGAHVGMRGLVKLSDMKLDVDEPSDLMNATEQVVDQETESSAQRNVNVSGLRAYHMGPFDTGGPRTADESSNLDDMVIGILGRDQQLAKYSNPCLLGYLFPTLYPKGRGFFSKDYDGIEGDQNQRIQYYDDNIDNHLVAQNDYDEKDVEGYMSGSSSDGKESDEHDESEEADIEPGGETEFSKYTIKSYAKFRLLSVDRCWGRNVKFILMMFDWIQKSAIFSYQMRLASITTAGRATRAYDILERSNNGQ